MKLADLLKGRSPEVVRIKTGDCIADAAVSLTENKIGALLVEDDNGAIAGILSNAISSAAWRRMARICTTWRYPS